MSDLQPYVEARDCIRAHANVRGQHDDVNALGRRGDRVYITWRTDMGRHLGWVPAADVERIYAARRLQRPVQRRTARPATAITVEGGPSSLVSRCR